MVELSSTKEYKKLIRRRVIFVKGSTSMVDVVTQMREFNISCVLVTGDHQEIVGIITERDIVQKFTLLDIPDKLAAKALAFMTRPVIMARLDFLEKDVRTLFLEKKIRHFPVTTAGNHIDDIIGIMTVTDLAQAMVSHQTGIPLKAHKEHMIIVVGAEKFRSHFSKLLTALAFYPLTDADDEILIKRAISLGLPVVLDLDGLGIEAAKKYLSLLKDQKQLVLLLSSQDAIVTPLRKVLTAENFQIVHKPMEITDLLRMLSVVRP